MPYETRIVRSRQSPAVQIICDSCDSLISRRKYNNARRFGQEPACQKCGGKVFTATAPHVIRGGRLIWTPRRKIGRKFVQGKREGK